ncbi:MAG: response regulator transcription factor [Dermatophilaceae bacterium]
MEHSGGVAVVAPEGSTFAVALVAALRHHGWDVALVTGGTTRYAAARTLLVVEDDDGIPTLLLPRDAVARGGIAVGSTRSLPQLVAMAARGVLVLNQAAPFLSLVRGVERALDEPRLMQAGQVERLRQRAAEQAALSRLTEAETDALDGLVAGMSAAEIARRSHRSLHTVRSHIKAVLAKLEVSSQVAAVAIVRRSGSGARADAAWALDHSLL